MLWTHLLRSGGEVLIGLAVVHRHAVARQVHVAQPVLRARVVMFRRRPEPAVAAETNKLSPSVVCLNRRYYIQLPHCLPIPFCIDSDLTWHC